MKRRTIIKNSKKIVIKANERQIKELRSDFPSISIKELTNSLYELTPKSKTKLVPALMEDKTIGGISTVRKNRINEFDLSEIFYDKSSQKKGFKIISDDYSAIRGGKLFNAFYLIESRLRKIVEESNTTKIKSPSAYRSKSYDHQISQYTLSELFDLFLFQPASDPFLISEFNKSDKSENSFLRIKNLSKLDELEIDLTQDDLEYLKSIRNSCMHFRVIPTKDYVKTISIINRYLRLVHSKGILRAFTKAISINIKDYTNFGSISIATNMINSYFTNYNSTIKKLLAIELPKYQDLISNSLSSLKI